MPGSLIQRQARRCGLYVLLVCLLALSGCQFSGQSSTEKVSLPQLPKGWSWYHDSVYPFDLPVPAGWQAFGYWNEYVKGDHCQRNVDLIPATWVQQYHSDSLRVPESISLYIPTTCSANSSTYQSDPHWKPAGSTTLGGKTASLYTQIDEAGDMRSVAAQFGEHEYVLDFSNEYSAQRNPPSDASQVALFDIVRENFTYHG